MYLCIYVSIFVCMCFCLYAILVFKILGRKQPFRSYTSLKHSQKLSRVAVVRKVKIENWSNFMSKLKHFNTCYHSKKNKNHSSGSGIHLTKHWLRCIYDIHYAVMYAFFKIFYSYSSIALKIYQLFFIKNESTLKTICQSSLNE